MKIYLDNCCFNRPFDDQSQIRISLEVQAKLYIQQLVRNGDVQMASSYMLEYENSCNPHQNRKTYIENFLRLAYINIDWEKENEVKKMALQIQADGIHTKDAIHIASAIIARCDYFLTTDDKLLKYKCDKIVILSPVAFLIEWENVDE